MLASFSYILPFLLSVLVMMYCNSVVLYRLLQLLSTADSFDYGRNSSVGAVPSSLAGAVSGGRSGMCAQLAAAREGLARLDEKSLAIVMRILLIPIFYTIIGVAGPTIYYLFPSSRLVYVVMTDLNGVANWVAWVAVNRPVMRLWQRVLTCSSGAERDCGSNADAAGTDSLSESLTDGAEMGSVNGL